MLTVAKQVNPEISFSMNINGQQKIVLNLCVDQGKFHVEIPEGVEATEAAKSFLTILTEIYPEWIAARESTVEISTIEPNFDFHDPWYAGLTSDSGMPADAFFLDAEDTVEVIHQPAATKAVKISDLPKMESQSEVYSGLWFNPVDETIRTCGNNPITYDMVQTVLDQKAREVTLSFALDDALMVYPETRLPDPKLMDKPEMTSGLYLRPAGEERLDSITSRVEAAKPRAEEVSWTSGTYEKE